MIPMMAPVDRPPVDDEVGAGVGAEVEAEVRAGVGVGSTKTN